MAKAAKAKSTRKNPVKDETQGERFAETARMLGADETGVAFSEAFSCLFLTIKPAELAAKELESKDD